MKKKYKIIIGAVLLAILAAYTGWSALRPLPVQTGTLTYGEMEETYTVQGTVQPKRSVVLNAGANGTVTELPFRTGQEVGEGQTVVTLSGVGEGDAETDLRLAQMRQSLAMARQEYGARFGAGGSAGVKLELARSAYETAKWDYEALLAVNETMPGSYPESELLTLQSKLAAAEQNLLLAQNEDSAATRTYYREQIASWEEQISVLESTIVSDPVLAPFDSVLWETYVETGAYVTKHQPLVKLYQAGSLGLEAEVLTEDVLGMAPGQSARCTLADGTSFTARVSYLSPVAAKGMSAVGIEEYRNTVELEPEDLPAVCGAGYQVDISFVNRLADRVLTAPAAALIPLPDGGDAVYLIRDGKAALAPVTAGRRSGGYVELSEGCQAGDVLILNPYDLSLKEGSRVIAE